MKSKIRSAIFLVKNKNLNLFIFSVAVMVLVLWPLVTGKVVLGDPYFFQLPYFNFYKQALNTDQDFLWNPHNANGFPAYASINGMFFPLHYIFLKYLPLITAFNVLIFLASVCALFFTILFLKELGIGVWGSVIGGLSFVISEMYFFANITAVSYSLVFLPLLFLIILKMAKSGSPRRYVVWGGLTVGLSWLSIMPHFVLWIIVAAGSFAIYLVIKGVRRRVLWNFILINIIGVVIGLVQIWPTFWAANLSSRGLAIPYSQLSEHSVRLVDLPRFFSPDFYNDLPVYISRDNTTQGSEESLYMGAIPFLFFIASFFVKAPFIKFFRWLFLACLLIGIKYSPLFWIITKVPILNSFRVPSRFMLIGSFATAVLVALALNFFIHRDKSQKESALCLLSIIGFIAVLSVLMFVSYFRIVYVRDLMSISGKILIPFLFLAVGYLSMRFLYTGRYKFPLFVLVFITVLDFVIVFRLYNDFAVLEANKDIPTLDFLKNNHGKSVSLLGDEFQDFISKNGFGENLPDRLYLPNLLLGSNLNLLRGLESGSYYEKLLDYDAARLFGMIGTSAGEIFDEKKEIILPPLKESDKLVKTLKERRELFDFLGINYIISGFDLSLLGMERMAMYPVAYNVKDNEPINVAIFRNPNAKPLFYFADKIDGFYSDDSDAFNKFSESQFRGVYVSCDDCNTYSFSGLGDIELKERKNSDVKIVTNSSSNQFLIMSQNYYPGWEAFIDGQETKIYKVNTANMGVFIPLGAHKVIFKYSYYLPWNQI